MEFKRVILFSGYTAFNGILPPEEFKKFAAVAAETGFTHVDLGCSMLERSRHQLLNNGVWCKGYDFYPEYTAAFPGFFKFYVPGALKAYLPEETAKRNLESMHVRAEILQSLGLKGSFLGGEPQFLPEKAFQDHPEWRGARCDLPDAVRSPTGLPVSISRRSSHFTPKLPTPFAMQRPVLNMSTC